MISFNPFLLRCVVKASLQFPIPSPSTHLPSPRISVLPHTTDYDVDVVVTEQGLVCAVSHLGREPMSIIKDYGYHECARPGSP
jgi:hypothetical protein